MFEFFNKL